MKKQKGFTLIEVIAIVVVMVIVGSIAFASISGTIRHSKERACRETRVGMLDAVRLMTSTADYTDKEAYDELLTGTSTYLIGEPTCDGVDELIPIYDANGNLIDIACDEYGYIYTSNQSLGTNYFRFEFEDDDFEPVNYLQDVPHLTVNDDGTLTATGGHVFMGTDGSDNYSLSTLADIADRGKGFGFMLETRLKLDENGEPDPDLDSGYAFQFDPGLGPRIIMRQRIDGRETNGPRVDLRDFFDNEDGSEINTDWLRDEHHIEVRVTKTSETTKGVLMIVDGVEIKGSNVDGGSGFTATINTNNNTNGYSETKYTGLRTWTGDVTFEDFEYNSE